MDQLRSSRLSRIRVIGNKCPEGHVFTSLLPRWWFSFSTVSLCEPWLAVTVHLQVAWLWHWFLPDCVVLKDPAMQDSRVPSSFFTSLTKSVGIIRNLLKDWLKKAGQILLLRGFTWLAREAGTWHWEGVFSSVLYIYGITSMWLVEISWSSKLREPSKPSVEIKTVGPSALLGSDVGILSSVSHFVLKHIYLLTLVILSSVLQLAPQSSVVLCSAE